MKVAELERRCDMYERVLREIASGGIIVCNDEEEDESYYIYTLGYVRGLAKNALARSYEMKRKRIFGVEL